VGAVGAVGAAVMKRYLGSPSSGMEGAFPSGKSSSPRGRGDQTGSSHKPWAGSIHASDLPQVGEDDLHRVAVVKAERVPQLNGGGDLDDATVVVPGPRLVLVRAEDEPRCSPDGAPNDVHTDSAPQPGRVDPKAFQRQPPLTVQHDVEASGEESSAGHKFVGIRVLDHPAGEITTPARHATVQHFHVQSLAPIKVATYGVSPSLRMPS